MLLKRLEGHLSLQHSLPSPSVKGLMELQLEALSFSFHFLFNLLNNEPGELF